MALSVIAASATTPTLAQLHATSPIAPRPAPCSTRQSAPIGGAYATVHSTANAPSTPAAVPNALGDDGRNGRRSKLVVLVDDL